MFGSSWKGRIPDSGLEDFILDKICFPTEAAKGPEYTISNIIDAVYKVMQKTMLMQRTQWG